ncbi:MAG: murein transglycosylase A [Desulfobulbaceae bacterium]|nr:murein transglycosylase A [Desulfobulbaceae bacterium]
MKGMICVVWLFLMLLSAPCLACENALLPVPQKSFPFFSDDLDFQGIKQGLAGSISYLEQIGDERQFELCGATYSAKWLKSSLQIFLQGVANYADQAKFEKFLIANFRICKAAGQDESGSMLVTGYYEPILAGSLVRKKPYIYPLYGTPVDLVVRKNDKGKKEVGRLEKGIFRPYWTRREIETENLLAGQEMIYLADPVEAFILHVQGSGKVRLPDGTLRNVRFAGSNGHKYRSIGKVMVERGIMALDEVTMPKIVAYLHNHPEERESILNSNDRFIFFSVSKKPESKADGGPVGSLGRSLTAGRSLALDAKCFPAPLIGYIESDLPEFDDKGNVIGWHPLRRFVMNQDSGAAIKGAGRVDLFCGSDQYAARAAGVLKQKGSLYFFILRKDAAVNGKGS